MLADRDGRKAGRFGKRRDSEPFASAVAEREMRCVGL